MLTSYLGIAQFGSQPGHYHNWDFCDLIQFLRVNARMLSQITPWPLSSALFPLRYLHIVSVFDSFQSEPLTELRNKPQTNQNHCCHNTTNKQTTLHLWHHWQTKGNAVMAPWANSKHCCRVTMGKQKPLLSCHHGQTEMLMSWHHGQTETSALVSPWANRNADVVTPWANRNYCSYDTTGKQEAQLSWHHGQTETSALVSPWANRNADVMTPWANRNYCSYDTTGKQEAQLSWHLSPLMSRFIFRNHLLPSDTIILHVCSWGSILIYTKKQIRLDSQIYSCGFFLKAFLSWLFLLTWNAKRWC